MLNVFVSFCPFSALKVCFESLRNVFLSLQIISLVSCYLLYRQICCQRILWHFVGIPRR